MILIHILYKHISMSNHKISLIYSNQSISESINKNNIINSFSNQNKKSISSPKLSNLTLKPLCPRMNETGH
jgi:hypothetical protein